MLPSMIACSDGRSGSQGPGVDLSEPAAMDAALPGVDGGVLNTDVTYYWILGQLPAQTTAYLYAPSGASVTFGGSNSTPVVKTIPADTFVSFHVADLGYMQAGTDWYFLDATGDKPFMLNFDRVVSVLTGASTMEDQHGDSIHDKPPTALGTSFTFPWGQSGPSDDRLIIYAAAPTNVTITRIQDQSKMSLTVSVDKLYVSDVIANWLGATAGYTLLVTADKPIACGIFDELPKFPNTSFGSGYYFGEAGQATLYDDYMHFHLTGSVVDSYYVTGANTLTHLDNTGAVVGTPLSFTGETSLYVSYDTVGYVTTPPLFVHVKGTSAFADLARTPTATDTVADAAYMGWNASLGKLSMYATEAAVVTIYDGRNHTVVGTVSLSANQVYSAALDTLGFSPSAPFLVAISSTVPIFQEVYIPYVLRQYPASFGPQIL